MKENIYFQLFHKTFSFPEQYITYTLVANLFHLKFPLLYMVSTKELLYVFKTNTKNKILLTYNFTFTSVDKETLSFVSNDMVLLLLHTTAARCHYF